MKGAFSISVQNNKVKYEFTLRRNITVIQGDSATGKTTLVDLIREHELNGADSGISLSSEKKCRVLEGLEWKIKLESISDSIVFIDEGNRFVESKDFASAIKESGNYFVIVTREGLENLPYSVGEIYGIHSSGKYADLKPVYHEFYKIYGNGFNCSAVDKIITEDSNSGFQFFSSVLNGKVECESADGKSNIYKKLLAVGHEKNLFLFLPESFEWLILQSGILRDSSVEKILESPQHFIESKEFFRWEQFFTNLLIEKTNGTYLQYSKKVLNKNYMTNQAKDIIFKSKGLEGLDKLIHN